LGSSGSRVGVERRLSWCDVVPVIGVLALQGDVREHLAALAACGVRAVPVRRPAELDVVDALVIPGGESFSA
jgi:pyridoxal 5'-phosphate synthase pdxT subunit